MQENQMFIDLRCWFWQWPEEKFDVNAKASSSSGVNFPLCIYNHLVTWGFGDLEIGDNLSETEAGQKICIVRLWCTQVRVSDRPSITEVVEILEGNIDSLQMPPKPTFLIIINLSKTHVNRRSWGPIGSSWWSVADFLASTITFASNHNVEGHFGDWLDIL